jgi:hypothetical protein
MSFREQLQWLQDADRMTAWLETRRAWIDKDGVIHEQASKLEVAEEQARYSAPPTPENPSASTRADPRG